MAKRKLTAEQEQALLDDYDKWSKFDPESETAEEIAARHGVTKATLYRILETRGRTTTSPVTSPGGEGQGLEGVVRFLTEELVKARIQVETNRGRIEALEARVRELESQGQ